MAEEKYVPRLKTKYNNEVKQQNIFFQTYFKH